MAASRKVYNEAGEVRCSSCGGFFPNTVAHFVTDKGCHNGLSAKCKACANRVSNERYAAPNPRLYKDGEGRVCTRCKTWKPWENYRWCSKAKPSRGREAKCVDCLRVEKKLQWLKHKDAPGARERRNQYHTEHKQRLRAETLAAYGNKCACCGESRVEFLGIDHTKGGGGQHRKQLQKAGINFYCWLRQQGYPRDDYQLLCHNCNLAKGFYGYCPHEREREHASKSQ